MARLVRRVDVRDKMRVRRLIEPIVSLALPPRCPGCGAITSEDHRFCAGCWGSLRFLGPPWCAACHAPFAHDRGNGAMCGDCLARPPRHGGIDAAVAYGPVARTVALRLKYAGRTAFAETAAALMVRHLPGDADLLVPVPLHRWRIWSRGFNQAALIAGTLGRMRGIATDLRVLERHRATPVLRALGARGRHRAVRGAFRIAHDAGHRIRGKRVVLIDDVHTSGATTDACARVLLAGGAEQVRVLCWARVVEGETAD